MTDWEARYRRMAKYFLMDMEGDTHHIESAYAMLREDGIVDEDGFEIHEEDEDD